MSRRLLDSAPAAVVALLLALRGGVLALPIALALALAVALTAPAAAAALRGRPWVDLGPLDRALPVALAWFALTTLFGAYPGAGVTALATGAIAAIVFRAAAAASLDPVRAWRQAEALVLVSAAAAAIGLGACLAHGGPAHGPAALPLVNHNHLASLAGAALPLALALAFEPPPPFVRALPRPLFAAAAGALGIALCFTVSRAGIAAGVTGLLATAAILLRRRGDAGRYAPGIAALGVTLAAAAIAIAPLAARLAPASIAISAGERAAILRGGWAAFLSSPLRGSGAGSFAVLFPSFRHGVPYRVDHAHQEALELLVEGGAIGLAAVLLLILLIAREPVQAMLEERPLRRISGATMAGVGVLLVHGLADFPTRIPAIAALGAWLAGIAVGSARLRRAGMRVYGPEAPESVPRRDRAGLAAVAAGAVVMLVFVSLHAAGAARGDRRISPWNAGLWRAAGDAALDRALAGDPAAIDEAGRLYAAAEARNVFDPAVHLALARLQFLVGDVESARDELRAMHAVDPDDPAWSVAEAKAELDAGLSDDAVATVRALIAAHPEREAAALALLWDRSPDPVFLRSAMPAGDGRALRGLSAFLETEGLALDARAALDGAAALEPSLYGVEAALAAERAGDAPAAVDWAGKAVAAAGIVCPARGAPGKDPSPEAVQALLLRARLEDVAAARVDSDCARQLAPARTDVWLATASVAARAGADDDARAAWTKAAELDPADPSPLVALADFESSRARWTDAIAAARAAEKRRTCEGAGLRALQRVLVAQKMPDAAQAELDDVRRLCPSLAP